jgi:hypothetical protein
MHDWGGVMDIRVRINCSNIRMFVDEIAMLNVDGSMLNWGTRMVNWLMLMVRVGYCLLMRCNFIIVWKICARRDLMTVTKFMVTIPLVTIPMITTHVVTIVMVTILMVPMMVVDVMQVTVMLVFMEFVLMVVVRGSMIHMVVINFLWRVMFVVQMMLDRLSVVSIVLV